MAWVYYINSGELWQGSEIVARGYSGRRPFLNMAAATDRIGLGPIPIGYWTIGNGVDHPNLGPLSIALYPITYKGPRSAFFIHGDNAKRDQSASRGCIILDRRIRDMLNASRDKVLLVVA